MTGWVLNKNYELSRGIYEFLAIFKLEDISESKQKRLRDEFLAKIINFQLLIISYQLIKLI